MKHLRIIAMVSFIAMFAACKSKDKKKDQTSADTTVVTPTDNSTVNNPTTSPMGPTHVMVVRHKVADYGKWLPNYEGHDSARLANGLHSYIIARGVEADSNSILIAMTYDDLEKAKGMANSPDLKTIMKKAGVLGAPTINYLEADMNDTTSLAAMTRVMVKHKVKDFAAWKKVFDADKESRMAAGFTDRVLAHEAGDPNTIVIVFAVSDLPKAKAFAASPDLKAKMDSAGVVGKPDFFYYQVVKKYM